MFEFTLDGSMGLVYVVVVSTPLKNMSQIRSFPQVGLKIKHAYLSCHHLQTTCVARYNQPPQPFFVGATSRVPKLLWLLLPRLHPPVKKAGFRCFAAADAMDEKLGLDDPGTERKRKWSGWIKWWVRDQWIHWSNLNVMLKLQLNLRVSPSCRINGFSCFTYFIHLGYILVWKKPTWS